MNKYYLIVNNVDYTDNGGRIQSVSMEEYDTLEEAQIDVPVADNYIILKGCVVEGDIKDF